MDLSAAEHLTLSSAYGNFDMSAQMATLTNGVVLESSEGYRLESARLMLALDRVDIHTGTAVHVTGPGLDLTADAMEFAGPDGQAILRFTGSVRMVYDPQVAAP
jgi:lipopolysaccharide export system protein LptC